MALGLPRIRTWRGKLRQNCVEPLHLRNELLVVPYLQFKPTLLNLLQRRAPLVKVVRNEHVDTTHSCKCNQGIGPVPEGALATSMRSVQLVIRRRAPDCATGTSSGGIEKLHGLPDVVRRLRQLIFLEVVDQQSDRGAPLKPVG